MVIFDMYKYKRIIPLLLALFVSVFASPLRAANLEYIHYDYFNTIGKEKDARIAIAPSQMSFIFESPITNNNKLFWGFDVQSSSVRLPQELHVPYYNSRSLYFSLGYAYRGIYKTSPYIVVGAGYSGILEVSLIEQIDEASGEVQRLNTLKKDSFFNLSAAAGVKFFVAESFYIDFRYKIQNIHFGTPTPIEKRAKNWTFFGLGVGISLK